MEHEGSHDLENEQQFWNGMTAPRPHAPRCQNVCHSIDANASPVPELEETVSKDCGSYTLIDDALRSYLSLITFSWGMAATGITAGQILLTQS